MIIKTLKRETARGETKGGGEGPYTTKLTSLITFFKRERTLSLGSSCVSVSHRAVVWGGTELESTSNSHPTAWAKAGVGAVVQSLHLPEGGRGRLPHLRVGPRKGGSP